MSCNPCKNYKGQICCWPEYGSCRDCLCEKHIRNWQKELRENCAKRYVYGPRKIDCPECPQRKKCQEELGWAGYRVRTQYEINKEKYMQEEVKTSVSPYFRIEKRNDGKYDIYLTGGGTQFHFVTEGEFIKE